MPSRRDDPAGFRYLSNQARMCADLAMSQLGRLIISCDASGTRTRAVSTLRSLSAS